MVMKKADLFLLVGRDDWQKDESLNLLLLQYLKKNNIPVIWEDPAAEFIYFLQKFERKFSTLPASIKKFNYRLLQLSYALIHPSYFSYLYRRRKNNFSIEYRCNELKRTIQNLGIAE